MALSATDVTRLAALARIDLDAKAAESLLADLNAVLGLIDRLQSVDTAGVAPMTHPLEIELRLREDAVTEPDARQALQVGAPSTEAGLYLVPRVIE
jgi:aspartyl-tRNA(Asn)/glutamyl-tRNA(Gln) amidotransferase subunit C